MVYDFKSTARIPKGVTADGVMDERERIVAEYGKASIEASTNAVMSEPEAFPNLRAFGPVDPEEAMREGIAAGIRHAYAAVIPVRVETEEKGPKPREVRVLFAVHDAEGDVVFEPINVIKESEAQRKELIGQLRRDAQAFANKMQDVLAELEDVS